MHNVNVENYVLFCILFEDFKPGKQPLRIVLRDCLEEVRKEPEYIGILQQRSGSQNSKILPLIKENQISQVNESSVFLCMGRCKSLGSLNSSL